MATESIHVRVGGSGGVSRRARVALHATGPPRSAAKSVNRSFGSAFARGCKRIADQSPVGSTAVGSPRSGSGRRAFLRGRRVVGIKIGRIGYVPSLFRAASVV